MKGGTTPALMEGSGGAVGTGGVTYVNDQTTQLELLRSNDVMVAWLLCQFHDGTAGRQPQPRHV